MSSKCTNVHDQIFKLMSQIEKEKVEKDLATNLKQKDLKQRIIDQWEEEIIRLKSALHRKVVWKKKEPNKEEPKRKKRKVFIEDPD